MKKVFISIFFLFIINVIFSQTLQLTAASPNEICSTGKDTFNFALEYQNIPSNSNIVFYQSTNPNFNPYAGEGDSIGFINIGGNTSNSGQITTPCAEIVGIFIDACDQGGVLREVDNEYVILTSGASGFDVNDLELYLPNSYINVPSTNSCIFQTPSAATMATLRNGTCDVTTLIAAGQGDVIPPNAIVIIFTGRGTVFNYNFSSYCSSGQPIYVLQNSCSPSVANYANNAPGNCPNKYRTTSIRVVSCVDELTYDPCSLPAYDSGNPNANDGNYAIHLPNTDTSSTYNGGIRNNAGNLCNGLVFDSIAGKLNFQFPIPNDGTGNGGTATNFCNDGKHYIKAITNPHGSQPISNTLDFRLVCLDVQTNSNRLSICSGDNAYLEIKSDNPNATFSWTVSGGTNITGASAGTGNTINQPLTYTGTNKDSLVYTITAKDGSCTVTKKVIVEVSKCDCHVNFEFGTPTATICTGSNLTLDASSAYDSYVWSTGATSHSIIVTQTGKYWVDVYKNGCKGSDTIIVVSSVRPNKPNLGRDTSFCSAFSLNLSNGNAANIATDWLLNNTLVSNAPTFTATQGGTYIVKVSNSCGVVSDTLVISASNALMVNLGNDTTLCNGNTLTLDATVAGNNIQYDWNTGAQTPTITINQFGVYNVNVSNGICSVSDTILVDFIDKPTIANLGNDTTICGDFSMQLFTGDAQTSWSTNETGPQITINKSGTYIAENKNQCGSIKDTIVITQFTKPSINIGADTTFCDSLMLDIGNGNFVSILWNTGDTIPAIFVKTSGTYSVQVQNQHCTASDSINVEHKCFYEVYMPTAFSPNGDGVNDFIAPLSYRKDVEILQFLIYNRWGELMYSNANFNPNSTTIGWDGNYKGAPAQVDDYVYIFKAKMPDDSVKSYKGIFTLLR
ncbi:MAG: gliding motility-associated C-terminal domain-containing protein [Chitinophagales bacterium]